MLLNRIGPFTAARQGLRIVGGRRPWKVMKLMSCFQHRRQSAQTITEL